jgi:hypothetical protein
VNCLFQKIEAFEHRMYSHPLHKDPKLEDLYKMKSHAHNISYSGARQGIQCHIPSFGFIIPFDC